MKEAVLALRDGIPADGSRAAHVGNRAGDGDIACAAVLIDVDAAARFNAVKSDADGVTCARFVLLDMGLVVTDDHFHVILLGQPDRIPAALGLDGVVNNIRFIEDIPLLRLSIANTM